MTPLSHRARGEVGALALTLPARPELEPLAEELFTALERRLPFERAAFCRVASPLEVEVVAVRSEGHPRPPVGTVIPLDEILGATAARVGLAVEVELSLSELPFDRLLYEEGFRYVLRMPIGSHNLAAAALAVLRKSRAFTAAEIGAVTEIATAAGPRVLALASEGQ